MGEHSRQSEGRSRRRARALSACVVSCKEEGHVSGMYFRDGFVGWGTYINRGRGSAPGATKAVAQSEEGFR